MQLPVDEKHNKQMMSVPELLETPIGLASVLLQRKPHHDAQGCSHDPASNTRTCRKVGNEKLAEDVPKGGRIC